MPRARVIVDTNVLISRLLLPSSAAGRAVSRLVEQAQLLVSDATLTELADVLTRAKFDAYVSIDDRQEFFRLFARLAEMVTVTSSVRECRDPSDDKFLELAIDGKATLMVSGDKDLLAMSPYRTTSILTPAQALALPASALTQGPPEESL